MALAAPTISEAERMHTIQARLPVRTWPARRLLITAVDARTGDYTLWDRTSGIPLASAVAASCAVPGVWPPATVAGRRYIDGSVRSATNADLAQRHDVVVVLAPDTGPGLNPASQGLTAEVSLLRTQPGAGHHARRRGAGCDRPQSAESRAAACIRPRRPAAGTGADQRPTQGLACSCRPMTHEP
ncbi:patatin-like phospholipase family protein [Streptomyces sp. NPDC050564]|uniref:patatin-like phospholipase family protein n=1 Tax=Streptomyces sp. NPDC050564 TaxID=3365631 RepID=UPI0037AE8BFC